MKKLAIALRNLAISILFWGSLYYQLRYPPEAQVVAGHPMLQGWFWILVAQLVISAVVTAVLTPKPKDAQPQKADVPQIEDGQRVRRIFGTVWVNDPGTLAMQEIDPPDPIKQKGGK